MGGYLQAKVMARRGMTALTMAEISLGIAVCVLISCDDIFYFFFHYFYSKADVLCFPTPMGQHPLTILTY